MLKALPGFALIELPKKYESGLTTEKEKYAIRSEGILRDFEVGDPIEIGGQVFPQGEAYRGLDGQTVYFAAFEDGEEIKHENKEYVFVPLKSLRGVKHDAEA